MSRGVALAPADQASESEEVQRMEERIGDPVGQEAGKPTVRTFGGILLYINIMNYIAHVHLYIYICIYVYIYIYIYICKSDDCICVIVHIKCLTIPAGHVVAVGTDL